jgi:hypothetical protein
LARPAPNFRERHTQNNTEITALFRLLTVPEQTAQIGSGFGLYRPEALVYLQIVVVVQKLIFDHCGFVSRASEPKSPG